MSIRFENDPATPPVYADLELTGPDGVSRRLGETGPSRFFALRATGLSPKTAYRYRVLTGPAAGKLQPAASGEGSFTTAPAPGESVPFTFLVYGDNRSDDAAHAAVVRAMSGVTADFYLHTGDFVEDGSVEAQWQRFFEIERPLLRDRCLFGAVGNHELVQPSGESFLRYFGDSASAEAKATDRRRFYRTVRWGSLRVFFLNAMDTQTSGEEKKWLEGELTKSAAEPGITFRLAVLHHGPFASGPHGPNPRLWNAGMVELLREHRIDLVFSGHDHIYERGDAKGMKYVVTGGGGAPLYPIRKRQASARVTESAHHFVEGRVSGQELALVARRVDGSILDRCGFAKGGGWDCDKTAKADDKGAPASQNVPAASTTPQGSRCGCATPGVPVSSSGAAIGAIVGALALARVRARRRRAITSS